MTSNAVCLPKDIPSGRKLRSLRSSLLLWYDKHRRRLPWREEPTAYRTVVSEFMLQQTTVAAVVPFFNRFVAQFPDFPALAAASEDEVLVAWSGLGYYRRARMLKHTAEAIMERHAGMLPRAADALRALPGFGPYTAAAVGSISLGLPLAAVDGNIRRVVSRLFAISGVANDRRTIREIESKAQLLLESRRPGDWNQAVMELGAMVCLPRAPKCVVCPVRNLCRAHATGDPSRFPSRRKAERVKQVREVAVALIKNGEALVLRRGEERAFAGMWELPRLDSREFAASSLKPEFVLSSLTGIKAGGFELLGVARAIFTHHRIRTHLYRAEVSTRRERSCKPKPSRHAEHQWIALDKLEGLAASKAQRRLFAILNEFSSPARRE